MRNITFGGMRPIACLPVLAFALCASGECLAGGDTTGVYFPFNESALTAEMSRRLDSALISGPLNRPGTFLIFGHTDAIGGGGYNLALSRKRALSVKAMLVSRGVSESDIKILTGLGESAAGEAASPDDRPQDRRVDVILSTSSAHSGTTRPAQTVQKFQTKAEPELPGRRRDSARNVNELAAGESLVLNNVYFFPGRHYVRPESYSQLEDLYLAMLNHPTMVIRIEGHVCCISPNSPDALDNDTRRIELSSNRAKAIRTMLIDRGIAPARIQAMGFGYRFPIFRNEENEEQANRNRRVEVRVLHP